MTDTKQATWLPVRDERVVRGDQPTTRTRFRRGRDHAHKTGGKRTGQWWQRVEVAEAVERGEPVEIQVALCGCHRDGWPAPPTLAGYARRASP